MPASYSQVMMIKMRLQGAEDTDFVIKINGFEWPVHSSVLKAQSNFFCKLIESGFKESKERSVTLHDDDPSIVARMICWLYTGEINCWAMDDRASWCLRTIQYMHSHQPIGISPSELMPQGSELVTLDTHLNGGDKQPVWQKVSKLYLLADKYDIPQLIVCTREAMKTLLKDPETHIHDLVQYLGYDALQRDISLFHSLVVIAIETSPSIAIADEIIEASGGQQWVESVVLGAMSVKFNEMQAHIKELERVLQCFPDGRFSDHKIEKRLRGIHEDLPDIIKKRPRFG